MLLKMLGKYALPQDGEIFFSARDLKRMPAGFQDEVKKAAESKNGSLTVSEEGRNIENGFILAYGGIEENCTLQAMFDAKEIDLTEYEAESSFHDATGAGRGYGCAGGVAEAIEKCINEYYPDVQVNIEHAEGLKECKKILTLAKAGNFMRKDFLSYFLKRFMKKSCYLYKVKAFLIKRIGTLTSYINL